MPYKYDIEQEQMNYATKLWFEQEVMNVAIEIWFWTSA